MTITTRNGVDYEHTEECVCEGRGEILKEDGFEMVDVYDCPEGERLGDEDPYQGISNVGADGSIYN